MAAERRASSGREVGNRVIMSWKDFMIFPEKNGHESRVRNFPVERHALPHPPATLDVARDLPRRARDSGQDRSDQGPACLSSAIRLAFTKVDICNERPSILAGRSLQRSRSSVSRSSTLHPYKRPYLGVDKRRRQKPLQVGCCFSADHRSFLVYVRCQKKEKRTSLYCTRARPGTSSTSREVFSLLLGAYPYQGEWIWLCP